MTRKQMTDKREWVWMPHAGHLIVGNDCRFHLCTYVNGYIVSTVGEWLPDSATWDIFADSKGIVLQGRGDERRYDFLKRVGYVEVGYDRTYETMVFHARKDDSKCCPWRMKSGAELDMEGYKTADDATEGHMKMCMKYAALAAGRNRG